MHSYTFCVPCCVSRVFKKAKKNLYQAEAKSIEQTQKKFVELCMAMVAIILLLLTSGSPHLVNTNTQSLSNFTYKLDCRTFKDCFLRVFQIFFFLFVFSFIYFLVFHFIIFCWLFYSFFFFCTSSLVLGVVLLFSLSLS